MGMSFLVNVLRLVHLPNLKVATMLLVGAMCYDIFWVYVQPHLFGHESVMVKVAKVRVHGPSLGYSLKYHCVASIKTFASCPTRSYLQGGENHESLPMLFLMPKIGGTAGEYSMLGYGDVILPGLLVVHNHLFENRCDTCDNQCHYCNECFVFLTMEFVCEYLIQCPNCRSGDRNIK